MPMYPPRLCRAATWTISAKMGRFAAANWWASERHVERAFIYTAMRVNEGLFIICTILRTLSGPSGRGMYTFRRHAYGYKINTLSTGKNAVIKHWMTARGKTLARHSSRKQFWGKMVFLCWSVWAKNGTSAMLVTTRSTRVVM